MISIIIPVYNTVNYIDDCVLSVISQTFSDWECILVDDGSSDSSGEHCDFWAEKDSRITVVHQLNKGVSAARNAGLRIAKGALVSFVDSDDWLDPDYLLLLYDKMASSNADLCLIGFSYEYSDRCIPNISTVGQITLCPDAVDGFVDLNKHFLVSVPVAKLYHSDIIRRYRLTFDETYSYGEDLLFNYAYLEHVKRIANIPDSKYHYRQIDGSLSHRVNPHQFKIDYEQWKVIQSFFKHKGLWLDSSRCFLYARLWGLVYDALFLFPRLPKKDYAYINFILQIPEIDCLKDYPDVFDCKPWIKWAILHRCAWLFYIRFCVL